MLMYAAICKTSHPPTNVTILRYMRASMKRYMRASYDKKVHACINNTAYVTVEEDAHLLNTQCFSGYAKTHRELQCSQDASCCVANWNSLHDNTQKHSAGSKDCPSRAPRCRSPRRNRHKLHAHLGTPTDQNVKNGSLKSWRQRTYQVINWLFVCPYFILIHVK